MTKEEAEKTLRAYLAALIGAYLAAPEGSAIEVELDSEIGGVATLLGISASDEKRAHPGPAGLPYPAADAVEQALDTMEAE